ncbi:P-type ATPase [Rhodoglobus sp.]
MENPYRGSVVAARHFRSPLIVFLLVAATVTPLLQDRVDATAILLVLVLVLNASIGFWEETHAEREMRVLASLSVPAARAVLDGHVIRFPALDLVPGDVVALESGEQIAADVRVINAHARQRQHQRQL